MSTRLGTSWFALVLAAATGMAMIAACHRSPTSAVPYPPSAKTAHLSTGSTAALTVPSASQAPGEVQLQLKGIITTAQEQRFLLSNAKGLQQQWVTVGDEYFGWKLVEYRSSSSVLVVKQSDGRELDLALSDAVTSESAPTAATVADAERLLQRINYAAMFAKIIDQQKSRISATIAAQVKGIKGDASDEEAKAFQQQVLDKLWSGVDNAALNQAIAKIYSQEFTAAQLNDIGDFYSTPTGQAAIAKTPEVSAQVGDALMAQIQANNPAAIAMMKSFARAHQAPAPAK